MFISLFLNSIFYLILRVPFINLNNMKKVLLHVCCAPCACYPVKAMRREGFDVTGYWYNPNIHPYIEYKRRMESLKDFEKLGALPVIYEDKYGLVEFINAVVDNPEFLVRCRWCYENRLEHTARTASEKGFDAFTSTLIYSIYQMHDYMKEFCYKLEKKYGVEFYYSDFREGWEEGIKISKELGLYRQKYCGCIYSEKERYLDKIKPPRWRKPGEDSSQKNN